jgi:hypothetical protein
MVGPFGRRASRNRGSGVVAFATPYRPGPGSAIDVSFDGVIEKLFHWTRRMRATLYGAAQSMLVRSTRWSWLKAWAMRVAGRCGIKRAIRTALLDVPHP